MKFLAQIQASIAKAQNTKELNLSDYQLDDTSVAELIPMISNIGLITLTLEHNSIGSSGAIKIATSLLTLKFLNLAYNNVGDEAMDTLVKSSIPKIDLRRNNFTSTGAQKFIGSGKYLFFEHNQLPPATMGQIAAQNKTFSA
jgi:Ran GTPase-activating protein (RanGAP) involved in mRNA processing and transport